MAQQSILGIIHKPWYLIRQILFVVDTFAKGYLMKTGSSYSFEIICKKIGVSSEIASMFLKHEVELDLNSSLFYGKDFKSIYSQGNKLPIHGIVSVPKASRTDRNSLKEYKLLSDAPKTSMNNRPNKILFWGIIVEGLKELGWTIENENRQRDKLYFPPGVERATLSKFRRRLDYFDSAILVIKCMETDKRYCERPEIGRAHV